MDIYDIAQSIADGTTVKILYESRLANVNMDEEGKLLIQKFDNELEQDEEIPDKQKRSGQNSKRLSAAGLHIFVPVSMI